MINRLNLRILAAFAALGVCTMMQPVSASPDTGFTYQGVLKEADAPLNADADLWCTLWDAATGGAQVGPVVAVDAITIVDGLFTVELDFGVDPYTPNESLWLEIAVRSPSGTGGFTTLTPRQRLTPAPFSLATRGLRVDADGNWYGDAGAAIGNDATIGLGGTWYPEYAHHYDLSGIVTDFSLSNLWSFNRTYATADPGEPVSDLAFYGFDAETFVPETQTGDFNVLNAGYAEVLHYGSGAASYIIGQYAGTIMQTPSSTYAMSGLYAQNWPSMGAQVTAVQGIETYALIGLDDSDPTVVTNNTGLLVYTPYPYASATVVNNYGIYLQDQNVADVENYAIYSEGGDVYFNGDLEVTGNVSKGGGSFKIDHPLDPTNKYLYHSFVESPDMKNIYDGVVITNAQGYAQVSLPDWFTALNGDFRYQLTVIGQFAQAIIAEEISNNRFGIRTDQPNVKVSWQVTGIRRDAYANAHRIPVEEVKPDGARGRYLHPEAFGRPRSLGEERSSREQSGEVSPPPVGKATANVRRGSR